MAVAMTFASGACASSSPQGELPFCSEDGTVCQSQRLASPGDIVALEFSGLRPNDELRTFSTISRYDGLQYEADGDGKFVLAIDVVGGETPGDHQIAVAQLPTPDFEPFYIAQATLVTRRDDGIVDDEIRARIDEYFRAEE
jgi:hypothetical protein